MEIETTKIKDLLIIRNPVYEDDRGFFTQWGQVMEISKVIKRDFEIKQFNHSRSKKNVLRGIHYENMDKLVYVSSGRAKCFLVDLNPKSPTFKEYVEVEIGDDNKVALFIPEGIGNSFFVLSEELNYIYLVSKEYSNTITRQIRWDDIDLNLPWPDKNPIISERDKTAQTLKEAFSL